MASFLRLLTFITSIILFGTANGQNTPVCSYTTDVTTLERCLDTVSFAIRAVLNASDDFDEACASLDYDRAASEGSDIAFLQILVCGSFGGQGQFYGNTDDAIEELALAEVALQVATEEPTNLALRYICQGLNLALYQKFQLPADTIYDAACSDLFIPRPSISISSSSVVSSNSIQSSSSSTVSLSSLTTPASYSTNATSWPSAYSSTSCTTSSSSIAIYKRQTADSDDVDSWIEVINSALFALGLIELNQDEETCDVGDYWIDQWNRMGYLGDYVQQLVCAAAANNTIFPPRTTVQARASLITTLRGIVLARDDPDNIARRVACDNLSYAVLSQAEFDPEDITNIIYYVCYPDGISSSIDGPTSTSSSSVSVTSTPSSTSATTTASESSSSATSSSSSTVSSASTSSSSTSTDSTSASSSSSSSSSTSTTSTSTTDSTSDSSSSSSSLSTSSASASTTDSTSDSSSSSSSSSTTTTSASTSDSTSESSSSSSSLSTSSTSASAVDSTSDSSSSSSSPSTSSSSLSTSSTTTTPTSSSLTTTSSISTTTPPTSSTTTTTTDSTASSDSSSSSASSSSSSSFDLNNTSSSSGSSSTALCSYVYENGGYDYRCASTTLDTSYSTTTTLRGYY